MFDPNLRFPTGIAYGSGGGPVFQTDAIVKRSGETVKNSVWQYPLQQYNILTGIKKAEDFEALRDLFYVLRADIGQVRFKDASDWKSGALYSPVTSADQPLGVGDGVQGQFPLQKTYTAGALNLVRPIFGVQSSSLVVEVGGVEATGSSYTYTPYTDYIQFATGSIPATGAAVKAGFEFDVIVEFGVLTLNTAIENCDSRDGELIFNIDSLPITEYRQAPTLV